MTSGVKDLRAALDGARERLKYQARGTLLFVDEVHRFNKSQQDALLPALEEGLVDFIGATTENPSFEVTAPLLSRSRVLRLLPLSDEDLVRLLGRGTEELGVEVSPRGLRISAAALGGDGRRLLNALEVGASGAEQRVEVGDIERAVGERALRYGREEHYDVISAFIKSVRGGDPDAALHYLARMLEAGEDPVFVARRLVILASEDIGNADPHGLPLRWPPRRRSGLSGCQRAASLSPRRRRIWRPPPSPTLLTWRSDEPSKTCGVGALRRSRFTFATLRPG